MRVLFWACARNSEHARIVLRVRTTSERSGKGLPQSLLLAECKTLLRTNNIIIPPLLLQEGGLCIQQGQNRLLSYLEVHQENIWVGCESRTCTGCHLLWDGSAAGCLVEGHVVGGLDSWISRHLGMSVCWQKLPTYSIKEFSTRNIFTSFIMVCSDKAWLENSFW